MSSRVPRPYTSKTYFAKRLRQLAARSGVHDEYVQIVLDDLYNAYSEAFRGSAWDYTHPACVAIHKIWPRKKLRCNYLPVRFVARQLLIRAGADLRPPTKRDQEHYGPVWQHICETNQWN